jgi:hypothetical protein
LVETIVTVSPRILLKAAGSTPALWLFIVMFSVVIAFSSAAGAPLKILLDARPADVATSGIG